MVHSLFLSLLFLAAVILNQLWCTFSLNQDAASESPPQPSTQLLLIIKPCANKRNYIPSLTGTIASRTTTIWYRKSFHDKLYVIMRSSEVMGIIQGHRKWTWTTCQRMGVTETGIRKEACPVKRTWTKAQRWQSRPHIHRKTGKSWGIPY